MRIADVGSSQRREHWRRVLSHAAHLAPPLLIALAIHSRALHTFFAQDDVTFLTRAARHLPISSVARSLSSGLAFQLEYAAFGLDPLGYHLVNLSLHLLNVAGVYALLVRLTGNLELLTGTLLLVATLLHVTRGHCGAVWRWLAALLALGAMMSKETAITWVGALAIIEWYRAPGKPAWSAIIPAAVVTVAFGASLFAAGTGLDTSPAGAYALNASPDFLTINLLTYTLWCLAVWNPIP